MMLSKTARRRLLPLACSLLLLAAGRVAPAAAEEASPPPEPRAEIAVGAWLQLGPVPVPRPAFAVEPGVSGEPLAVAALLGAAFPEPPAVGPEAGDTVAWAGGGTLTWSSVAGEPAPGEPGGMPRAAWLAAYLTAERFVEAKLTVTTGHLARVFLDGEAVGEKTAADDADAAEPGTVTAEVALVTGEHRLWVELLADPAGPADWTAAAKLEVPESRAASLSVAASSRHGVAIADLLDVDAVTGLAVSAAGDLVAVELAHPSVPSDDRETWVEIRRTADGAPVTSFRGAPSVESFTWGPGRRFSYVTRKDEKATLWIGDLGGGDDPVGAVRPLLEGVEKLESHRWSPDGSFLLYTLTEEPPEDERGVQRMRDLRDRWSDGRQRASLWQVSTADGTRRRLTAGGLGATLEDIAADGSRALISRTRYTSERPFSVGELWEIPLGEAADLTPAKLTDVTWLEGARYAPDGEGVLVKAGPSGFGDLGVVVPEGADPAGFIPNEYDRQLYLLHRGSGEVEPLTRGFDPSVHDFAASRRDGRVYLTAEDGSRVRLYRLTMAQKRFEALATGVEVVGSFSLAADGPTAVWVGSSVTTPPRVLAAEVAGGEGGGGAGEPRLLLDPASERFEHVVFGRVEDWSFEANEEDGQKRRIPGRIHYPPSFDAASPGRRWPLIVYYYGGTVPIERAFGGRYPKNLWTAHGYVVLILQPSGATGYGQQRSSLHVNDWGQRVSREILQGVETFLAEHTFVDPGRVGCFGGSYGGFMTLRLVADSDLFAAAIAHAGISSLGSYWGQGWWGYLYSAVASAGSYPWNRRDLYVDQSPLFSADRIHTPLLLLHGTADPNVPPGESEQMYTALELLGREVELVKIEGEAHWIQTYGKRKLWWESILAWFDKHLKGEPEWWEFLWKNKG
jgi:dipeptidyl aminopeptidase/acylaminoacyl peptidase